MTTTTTPTSYSGTPENYLRVPKTSDLDFDALTCALSRAHAVCLMLAGNFDGSGATLNNEILTNACWTLEGLIEQAQIIVMANESFTPKA